MPSPELLGHHLQTFFHEYLTTQRNVSPHTVLSYRDSLKLLLRFAMKRHRKEVAALVLADLGVETVLAFLDHLERERGNSIATRNARLAGLHVFFKHVAARDPEFTPPSPGSALPKEYSDRRRSTD